MRWLLLEMMKKNKFLFSINKKENIMKLHSITNVSMEIKEIEKYKRGERKC